MILIADNDDSTRMVLTCSLERSGYTVEPVTDGQLLWPRLEAGGVELLILDLRMPGMNGWEVLRRLRDRYRRESEPIPELPVIVISAQSDPETKSFAVRLGAAAFVAKPIDLKDLAHTVRKVLRQTAS
jgi:two-component system OmpR family response regulator